MCICTPALLILRVRSSGQLGASCDRSVFEGRVYDQIGCAHADRRAERDVNRDRSSSTNECAVGTMISDTQAPLWEQGERGVSSRDAIIRRKADVACSVSSNLEHPGGRGY